MTLAPTPPNPIRFDDGAAYEHGMGVWSRMVGQVFLDWLHPPAGLRWIDVGCGNGAFTELLIERCTPAEVQALDPSEGQLAFARSRTGAKSAVFHQGDAMALPFPDARFDAASMALVLFFVPEPARGLAEMKRVVRPGGLVAAYVWDIHAGGLPIEPVRIGLRSIGVDSAIPPSADVSRPDALRAAFTEAGLEQVETLEIRPERHFPDFDAYWNAALMVGSLGETVRRLSDADLARVQTATRPLLDIAPSGAVVARARANAIKARVPAADSSPS